MTTDKLKEIQALGEELKAFREKLPADSPLAGPAFQVAAIAGKIEALIASQKESEAQ